jgi:hypothetical protein
MQAFPTLASRSASPLTHTPPTDPGREGGAPRHVPQLPVQGPLHGQRHRDRLPELPEADAAGAARPLFQLTAPPYTAKTATLLPSTTLSLIHTPSSSPHPLTPPPFTTRRSPPAPSPPAACRARRRSSCCTTSSTARDPARRWRSPASTAAATTRSSTRAAASPCSRRTSRPTGCAGLLRAGLWGSWSGWWAASSLSHSFNLLIAQPLTHRLHLPSPPQVSKASDLFSIYKLTDEDKAQILRLAADKNIGARPCTPLPASPLIQHQVHTPCQCAATPCSSQPPLPTNTPSPPPSPPPPRPAHHQVDRALHLRPRQHQDLPGPRAVWRRGEAAQPQVRAAPALPARAGSLSPPVCSR